MSGLPGGEAEPLAVDLAAARRGLGEFVSSREPLVAYLAAISGVRLGARPVIVGGQEALRWDPLEKQPAAVARLARAFDHGGSLGSTLDTLHSWATGGMAAALRPVLEQLEIVKTLLEALPEDAPATAEEARQLAAAIGLAQLHTDYIGLAARLNRQSVLDFLGRLAEDHEAFIGGQAALATVVRQLESDFVAFAQPYLTRLEFRGIGEAILEIGRGTRDQLLRLDRYLGGALAGHAQIGGGISALATAVEAIAAKYASAQRAVARAANPDLPQVVRKLQPAKAISFWRDFLQFIETSGL